MQIGVFLFGNVDMPDAGWGGTLVDATGTAPLSYQWQKGGTNLTDGGNRSGSTTRLLTITNLAPADAGTYSGNEITCDEAESADRPLQSRTENIERIYIKEQMDRTVVKKK